MFNKVQQGLSSYESILEEGSACLWGLQLAKEYSFLKVKVEGDCLPLI